MGTFLCALCSESAKQEGDHEASPSQSRRLYRQDVYLRFWMSFPGFSFLITWVNHPETQRAFFDCHSLPVCYQSNSKAKITSFWEHGKLSEKNIYCNVLVAKIYAASEWRCVTIIMQWMGDDILAIFQIKYHKCLLGSKKLFPPQKIYNSTIYSDILLKTY